MIAAIQQKYEFPVTHVDPRDETSSQIISTRNKVILAACSVILLLGTAYYFLTGCNAYYCRPQPPCEPSFCELHQHERILGGSCYCPDWPNS